MKKIHIILSIILIASLQSCSSGKTDGGDQDGSGSVFVPDESNSGAVSLDLTETTLEVSDRAGFRFRVRDAQGNGVPNIRVLCDSESGVAILEPTTGSESTDSNGEISGQFGCRSNGSYLVGCRLPVGSNRRDFQTVICTGDVPNGFDGFPGAAGGGLGGGASDGDDSGVGGTNPNGLRIKGVTVTGVRSDTKFQVDTTRNTCSSSTSEVWDDDFLTITLVNNTNSTVRYTSGSFRSSGSSSTGSTVSSGDLNVTCEVRPNGGEATCTLPFTKIAGLTGSKTFAGTSTTLGITGSRNVSVSLVGELDGEEVEVTGGISVNYGAYDYCS